MEVGGGRVVEKVESRNFFSELLREEPERVVKKKNKNALSLTVQSSSESQG